MNEEDRKIRNLISEVIIECEVFISQDLGNRWKIKRISDWATQARVLFDVKISAAKKPEPTMRQMTAWIIQKTDTNASLPYWSGAGFHSDPKHALRFARKHDAEIVFHAFIDHFPMSCLAIEYTYLEANEISQPFGTAGSGGAEFTGIADETKGVGGMFQTGQITPPARGAGGGAYLGPKKAIEGAWVIRSGIDNPRYYWNGKIFVQFLNQAVKFESREFAEGVMKKYPSSFPDGCRVIEMPNATPTATGATRAVEEPEDAREWSEHPDAQGCTKAEFEAKKLIREYANELVKHLSENAAQILSFHAPSIAAKLCDAGLLRAEEVVVIGPKKESPQIVALNWAIDKNIRPAAYAKEMAASVAALIEKDRAS